MARPSVHFLSSKHIYHPLVHPKTNEVNLDFDFINWQPGKHWAITILLSIKKMIHLEPYYKLQGKEGLAWNKEAHDSFVNRFEHSFIDRVSQCVTSSNEDRLKELKDANGETCSSLLKFMEWDPIHDVVSEKINGAVDSIAIDRELELEDEETLIETKKEQLKKWFVNNYANELNTRGNQQNDNQEGGSLAF